MIPKDSTIIKLSRILSGTDTLFPLKSVAVKDRHKSKPANPNDRHGAFIRPAAPVNKKSSDTDSENGSDVDAVFCAFDVLNLKGNGGNSWYLVLCLGKDFFVASNLYSTDSAAKGMSKYTASFSIDGRKWYTDMVRLRAYNIISHSSFKKVGRIEDIMVRAEIISILSRFIEDMAFQGKIDKMQLLEARYGQKECSVCGTLFVPHDKRQSVCSVKCRSKIASDRRRRRLKSVTNEGNITLEQVFQRDKGVCHICSGACFFDDFITIDGIVHTGPYYPSIDHVVPLSKGGENTIENTRLAHQKCNSKKGNKTVSAVVRMRPRSEDF